MVSADAGLESFSKGLVDKVAGFFEETGCLNGDPVWAEYNWIGWMVDGGMQDRGA